MKILKTAKQALCLLAVKEQKISMSVVNMAMDNFPKKDIELKNRIRMNSYDLLEIIYEANNSQNIELKKELLNKCLAKIKVIDFLLN